MATTIKVRWTVNELANVMSLFDTQRVWRTVSIETPNWIEVTTALTRVALVAGQVSYLFDDISGDASYYYGVTYYNTSTTAESAMSDPVRADLAGYVSVDDIRDEGFTETMVSDANVIKGIQRATSTIDRVTRQWFEPRTRTFVLDGRRGQDLLMNVPLIAVTSFGIVDSSGEVDSIDLTEVLVYNRHLTQGLLSPDDRDNPRIAWRDMLPSEMRYARNGSRDFVRGHRNIHVGGVFGYTELDSSSVPAETTPGSQIPSDYGNTPELIKLAALLLTIRHMYPRATGDGDAFIARNRVIEERTRDQMYKLADISESDASYGMTGDLEVDKILSTFISPMAVGVV